LSGEEKGDGERNKLELKAKLEEQAPQQRVGIRRLSGLPFFRTMVPLIIQSIIE
jgi:hypothetical protein